MTMSTWLGKIQFGLVSLDVSLERAVVDHSLRFKSIDRKTKEGIHRVNVDAEGNQVANDQLVKGFSINEKVVLFEDDEISELKGSLEHTIEIIDFIPNSDFPHGSLGTRYYVVPRGTGTSKYKAYRLLIAAMQSSRCFAVVRYVLRTKQYTGLCFVDGDKGFEYLVICSIPYPDELVDPKTVYYQYFQEVQEITVEPKMMKQAKTLISSMMDMRFVHEKYRDDYRDKVLAKVEEKLVAKDRKTKSNVIPINRKRAG